MVYKDEYLFLLKLERKKYNVHYFEPEDGFEQYPYEIPLELHEKYQNLEKYFNTFYTEDILEKAKKDAKIESESRKFIKENFIYGEVNFRSMSYILLYLNYKYGIKEGYFFDLGSGTGRAVIGAALTYPFSKYIGIELLETLYKASIEIKQLFEKDYNNNKKPDIEFINGDFLKQDLSKASVIFINSTTFSDKLLGDLADKFNNECDQGCLVVNTTMELSKLDKNKWEFLPYFRRYMSWGIATVNVYKRK